jgi:hypothetical protein
VGQDENIGPQVIPETLFTIFLEEYSNPNIFLFYSTNFIVMESLAQVSSTSSFSQLTVRPSFGGTRIGKIFESLNLLLMSFKD